MVETLPVGGLFIDTFSTVCIPGNSNDTRAYAGNGATDNSSNTAAYIGGGVAAAVVVVVAILVGVLFYRRYLSQFCVQFNVCAGGGGGEAVFGNDGEGVSSFRSRRCVSE